MKSIWAIIFFGILAVAFADCGCLKCGRHLRVISAPNSPCKVIVRGDACKCPKPIPYRVEIPHPPICKPCERKAYGYTVQTLKYDEPEDPIYYQYGFQIQVPKVEERPARHYVGLSTKCDRVVIPATDECPLPPPTRRPIIEYFAPSRVHEYPEEYELPIRRGKRSTFSDENIHIDWVKLLEPKEIKSTFIKNPWQKYVRQSAKPAAKSDIFRRLNINMDKSADRNVRANGVRKRTPLLDKPFRMNIPLNQRQQFFLQGKPKPKFKSPFEKVRKRGTEIDPLPTQTGKQIESKLFEKIVRKSGKFADVENVKITLPAPNRQKKIVNTPQAKGRYARSVTITDKDFPFYSISESSIENDIEYSEAANEDILEKAKITETEELQKTYLEPFNVKTILPQNQVFYMLNTPIRLLNHVHKLKKHVSPMVQSLPSVLDTSTNFILNLGKRFRRGTFDIMKDFMGRIKVFPGKLLFNTLLPTERNKKRIEKPRKLPNFLLNTRIAKRDDKPSLLNRAAIVKLVEPNDISEFVREKLYSSSDEGEKENQNYLNSDEDVLLPVLPEVSFNTELKQTIKNNKKQLILEKLRPKLSIHRKKAFIDIAGIKTPLIKNEDEDVQDIIQNIIEEVQLMASNPKVSQNEVDSDISTRSVKTKVTEILENIQLLMEEDFKKHEAVYEELLKLQNLKESVVKEWKQILIKKKHNDINIKVNLLNQINEVLSVKDDIVEMIGEVLSEDIHFNNNSLVKTLVRLQKLQCVLVKVVEDFAEDIHYQTPFDVEKEIKQVDLLENLNFVEDTTRLELSSFLRKERDLEIEKQMELLENLQHVLECDTCEDKTDKINDVAKILWELKNTKKMQKEAITDMNDKIQYGLKIRKELKIIFDLQKQLEICTNKLSELFDIILKKKVIKMNNLKSNILTKSRPLREKKQLIKNTVLKKPLISLKYKKQ